MQKCVAPGGRPLGRINTRRVRRETIAVPVVEVDGALHAAIMAYQPAMSIISSYPVYLAYRLQTRLRCSPAPGPRSAPLPTPFLWRRRTPSSSCPQPRGASREGPGVAAAMDVDEHQATADALAREGHACQLPDGRPTCPPSGPQPPGERQTRARAEQPSRPRPPVPPPAPKCRRIDVGQRSSRWPTPDPGRWCHDDRGA
jgi:hypothetical protein